MCGAGDPGLDTVWCAGVQGAGGGRWEQKGAEVSSALK